LVNFFLKILKYFVKLHGQKTFLFPGEKINKYPQNVNIYVPPVGADEVGDEVGVCLFWKFNYGRVGIYTIRIWQ
jgi:hypothetical protein